MIGLSSVLGRLVALALALSVAACATQTTQDTPAIEGSEGQTQAALSSPDNPLERRPAFSSVPTKGLPPQELGVGDCGLFLWSQTDVRNFIFFRKAGDGFARMLIGADSQRLTATDFSGDIFGQFFTDQSFDALDSGHTIDLRFSPGDDLVDGARVDSGRIRLTDADGWVTTIPIVGVRACRPEEEVPEGTEQTTAG